MPQLSTGYYRGIEASMGPFRVAKAFDRLEDRLARLETGAADRERESRKLNLEFTDLYDKVSRQMSRMAKRYAVDQKENGAGLEAEGLVPNDTGIDPISEKILARRSFLRRLA